MGAQRDGAMRSLHGFHTQTLVKLAATRQEADETLAVTTSIGGGPSLMRPASPITDFEEGSQPETSGA